MKQIIIGSSKFKTLTQYQLDRFLDHAYALGINKIDTAPLYDCEKMIGNYLNYNPNFSISTKTAYNIKSKEPLKILEKFHQSQKNLKIDTIDCLFFHSTPPSLISDANIKEINYLKDQKLIQKIGYSGSNFEVNDLKFRSQLDCLMITFNALDISDNNLIQQSNLEIYIKRPMANFIFKRDLLIDFKFCIRSLLHKKSVDTQDYHFRLKKCELKNSFNENLKFFIKFVTYFSPRANYVFGVSKIEHLEQIIKNIEMINNEITEDLIAYYQKLQILHERNNWKSLP